MAADARERSARGMEVATERIRELNEQILERIKSGGESALEAYERTLKDCRRVSGGGWPARRRMGHWTRSGAGAVHP
jgi:hypothetical protein